MMKLLLGFLVLVAALALAVELLAPRFAEARIEEHVREQTEGMVGVSADVGTFPVVTRLLATERVPRLAVTFDEVAGQALTFSTVRFELRGIALDRDSLLAGDVRVRGMQGGQVTAAIDAEALSDALGVPVRLEPDGVVATVAGTEVRVPLEVAGGALSLPAAGLTSIPLGHDLLPCTAEDSAITDGRVEVSCTLEDVPFFLT